MTGRLRAGLSLLEMIVALTVCGVVLAIVSNIAVRQQRFFSAFGERLASNSQLRQTAALLPIDLRGVASGEGDLRAGEARDTSLELRATIGSAVVCDTAADAIIAAPATRGVSTLASYLSTPQTNDTAWLLSTSPAAEEWRAFRVSSVAVIAGGRCAPGGPMLTDSALGVSRIRLTFDSFPRGQALVGAPFRVTRPIRYSLYRASDGAWYLGQRDWNPTLLRFNTIQPVSGPFLGASAGGLRFRYSDTAGVPLADTPPDTRKIADVSIALRGELHGATRGDSVLLEILLRNRR